MLMYEEGVSEETLVEFEEFLREPEKRDFVRSWGSISTAIRESAGVSTHVGTAFLDETPIAVFGVVPSSGAGVPWLALSTKCQNKPVLVFKEFREHARRFLDEFGYLENNVPADDADAIRLLERVGFTVDREDVSFREEAPYYNFFAMKGDV